MLKQKYTVTKIDAANHAEEVYSPYLNAFMQVYDEILIIDFNCKTIRNLHGELFCALKPRRRNTDIKRQLLDWASLQIAEADKNSVFSSLSDFFENPDGAVTKTQKIPITFSVESEGKTHYYRNVFLALENGIYLLCSLDITKQIEAEQLQKENQSLKDFNQHMKEVVMYLTSGMIAFKVENDIVTPLYFSENICRFFGIEADTWLYSMNKGMSISEFVTKGNFTYDDFQILLRDGEAEFDYVDVRTGQFKRVRAVCSDMESDRSYYVMMHEVSSDDEISENEDASEKENISDERPDIYIRTFGYFDVFIDGKPIAFRNEKAKELFALLVDRRGGFVTSGEAIGFLWENEPADRLTFARYRKVALRLKNFFDEYGIADIIETVGGKRRLVTEKVRCDLFDYLSKDMRAINSFNGLYLLNYSWGETTLGELLEYREQNTAKESE